MKEGQYIFWAGQSTVQAGPASVVILIYLIPFSFLTAGNPSVGEAVIVAVRSNCSVYTVKKMNI